MVDRHLDLFSKFSQIHDQFKQDNSKYQVQFDSIGKQVVQIITETENRLCSKMENSGRSNYSINLADKFRSEVRSHFPLIDLVGVTIS